MAWEAAQQQNATLMQMNAQALGAGSGPCKLYVGNLHPNISVRAARAAAPVVARWQVLSCAFVCQTVNLIIESCLRLITMLHAYDSRTPLCGMPSRLGRGREVAVRLC